MNAEELLKTLRDGGLDDAAIAKLLNDVLNILPKPEEPPANPENDEAAEKEKAGKLLGVTL